MIIIHFVSLSIIKTIESQTFFVLFRNKQKIWFLISFFVLKLYCRKFQLLREDLFSAIHHMVEGKDSFCLIHSQHKGLRQPGLWLAIQLSYLTRVKPQSSSSLKKFCVSDYNLVNIIDNILGRLCLKERGISKRSDSARQKRRKECSWGIY